MNSLETAIYRTGAAIFEELVFLFPTAELEDAQREAPARAAAEVAFSGPLNGRLVVVACGEVLPQLAENMLGEDGSHPEQVQRDALGEVANVICGNLLPALSDTKAVFRLDAPRVSAGAGDGVTPGAAAPSAEVRIGLDGGRADLRLYLHE
jgi:hypothetical protein